MSLNLPTTNPLLPLAFLALVVLVITFGLVLISILRFDRLPREEQRNLRRKASVEPLSTGALLLGVSFAFVMGTTLLYTTVDVINYNRSITALQTALTHHYHHGFTTDQVTGLLGVSQNRGPVFPRYNPDGTMLGTIVITVNGVPRVLSLTHEAGDTYQLTEADIGTLV